MSKAYLNYAAKRLVQAIVVILLAYVLTFVVVSILPGDPITNADLEPRVGPLPADILDGLEVKQRHWIADPATGEHRFSNSELAISAGLQALDRAQLSAEAPAAWRAVTVDAGPTVPRCIATWPPAAL